MTEKEQNVIDGIEYAKDIGYVQYLDRKPTQVHMLQDVREYALKKLTKDQELREKIRKSIDHFLYSETRIYNCGGLPVSLTLPKGKHRDWHRDIYRAMFMYGKL